MKGNFEIPVNGLNAGKTMFCWHIGKEFFEESEAMEILDADVTAEVAVEKSGNYLGVDCVLDGYITVPCDRCMEDLEIPVDEVVKLSVKFGKEPEESIAVAMTDNGREIIFLSDEEAVIDMAQIIYDYTLLAIPLQRVHPEGECNPEVMRFISQEGEISLKEETETISENNPFAALKGLFEDKGEN